MGHSQKTLCFDMAIDDEKVENFYDGFYQFTGTSLAEPVVNSAKVDTEIERDDDFYQFTGDSAVFPKADSEDSYLDVDKTADEKVGSRSDDEDQVKESLKLMQQV